MTYVTTMQGKFYLDCRFPPDIRDIAHSLAHQCRFNGMCSRFYSVAEHCVLLADLAENSEVAWACLLHDASEAYLSDLPHPVKHLPEMKPYRDLEAILDDMIRSEFEIDEKAWTAAKSLDRLIIKDEFDQLFVGHPGWDDHETSSAPDVGLGVKIQGWSPGIAKSRYLDRFARLEWERSKDVPA